MGGQKWRLACDFCVRFFWKFVLLFLLVLEVSHHVLTCAGKGHCTSAGKNTSTSLTREKKRLLLFNQHCFQNLVLIKLNFWYDHALPIRLNPSRNQGNKVSGSSQALKAAKLSDSSNSSSYVKDKTWYQDESLYMQGTRLRAISNSHWYQPMTTGN